MESEERIVIITSDTLYEFTKNIDGKLGVLYSINIVSEEEGVTELIYDNGGEILPEYMAIVINGATISQGIAALIVDAIYNSSEWQSLMKVVTESDKILDSQKALIDDVSASVFNVFRNTELDVIYIQ